VHWNPLSIVKRFNKFLFKNSKYVHFVINVNYECPYLRPIVGLWGQFLKWLSCLYFYQLLQSATKSWDAITRVNMPFSKQFYLIHIDYSNPCTRTTQYINSRNKTIITTHYKTTREGDFGNAMRIWFCATTWSLHTIQCSVRWKVVRFFLQDFKLVTFKLE